MSGTSVLFPPETLNQITAAVNSVVAQYAPLRITKQGLYAKGRFDDKEFALSTGAYQSHGASVGTSKILSIRRGYNPPATNSDTGTVYLNTTSVDSNFELTAGDSTTISTSVVNPATYASALHLTANIFAISYDTANPSGGTVVRVVDASGASMSLGTTVSGHSSQYLAVDSGGLLYSWYDTTAKYLSRSGTTLTENTLTLSGTPAGARRLVGIYSTNVFICLNTTDTTLEKWTLSGTTLTYQNTVSVASAGATLKVAIASSFQFLIDYGNGDVAGGYLGTSNGASIQVGSSTTISNVRGAIYNNFDSAFNVASLSSTTLTISKVTIGAASTSIAVESSRTVTVTNGNDSTTYRPVAFNSTLGLAVCLIGKYASTSNYLEKWGSGDTTYAVGYTADAIGTAGSTGTIILRRVFAGIKSQGKSTGNLTPGTNYYLGAGSVSTTSTDGPFIGWSIDSSNLIMSEAGLS